MKSWEAKYAQISYSQLKDCQPAIPYARRTQSVAPVISKHV